MFQQKFNLAYLYDNKRDVHNIFHPTSEIHQLVNISRAMCWISLKTKLSILPIAMAEYEKQLFLFLNHFVNRLEEYAFVICKKLLGKTFKTWNPHELKCFGLVKFSSLLCAILAFD